MALTYGFEGIDLAVVDFATRARLRGVPYARRLIDSAKIALGTFALPVDWEGDEETFEKDLAKLPEWRRRRRRWTACGAWPRWRGQRRLAVSREF